MARIATFVVIVMLLAGCDLAGPASDGLEPAEISQTESQRSGDVVPAAEDDEAAGTETSNGSGSDASGGGAGASADGGERPDDGEAEPAVYEGGDALIPDGGAAEGTEPADDSDSGEAGTTTREEAIRAANAGTMMGDMLTPDVSDGLPEGHAGSGRALSSPRPRSARQDRIGVFRTRCDFSHMAFDDPIVRPGEPGGSHLHAFFGNTDTDAHSTAASIATSGNSTCRGGILDRSAYWVPALLDVRSRKPVAPWVAQVYYRSGYGGISPASIEAMPDGLRMVAGNAASAGDPDDNPRAYWLCRAAGSGTEMRSPHIPSDCGSGDILRLTVEFPQCWDGQNLDAADHRSHMAYASRGCPSSHPVPLPQVVLNVAYKVDARAPEGWRLTSDAYDRNHPGGMSVHADWFNGWDRRTTQTWLDNCVAQQRNCKDGDLNDGSGLDRP